MGFFSNNKQRMETFASFLEAKEIVILSLYDYEYEDIKYLDNLYGPLTFLLDRNKTLCIGNKANILMQYLMIAKLLEIKIPKIFYAPFMTSDINFDTLYELHKEKLLKKIEEENINDINILTTQFIVYEKDNMDEL